MRMQPPNYIARTQRKCIAQRAYCQVLTWGGSVTIETDHKTKEGFKSRGCKKMKW